MKLAVFWVALMIEATSTSETLVNVYQTTRRYNPEDSHLRTRRRKNLKSHSERKPLYKNVKMSVRTASVCLSV
jgi:hypothetical protein